MLIDHIGVGVRSIEEAVEQWHRVFGYQPATRLVTNTSQKVRVVFLHKEGSTDIKLVEPEDETSPIYAFVRRGGGLHHLCWRCSSLDQELGRVASLGLRVVYPPAPGEAFDGERIAFVYGAGGLNIELIDTEKRAARLL